MFYNYIMYVIIDFLRISLIAYFFTILQKNVQNKELESPTKG